ncbi:cytochrome b/b6 domain-containing protein [Salipiger marinus]|uniref:Cytochrome b561 n=1 Tax=Salipiger marinus TaxID=555512 RepID=A0A1G8RBU9_9RHOB|nr:cytochrome b/b6 domain-containing protein [Salipiger marinus]SDJ14409.1 Cytochrome b561 [Salipiger marinus]
MTLTNSPRRYGTIARSLHWITATGILVMFPLGWAAHLAPWQTEAELALKAQLFSIHKTLGVALILVALLRVLWALSQPRPAPLHPGRRIETLLAETVHWALYAALILVPLSGWIAHAATTGFAPILWPFGQDLPFVPKSDALAHGAATVHLLSQWLLAAVLGLHVAGAVKHAVIDRDATLARMWRGTPAGQPAPHRGLAAIALALALWGVVLGGGAAAGLYSTDRPDPVPALAAAPSDWQVTEGALALRLRQMGREIEGEFSSWTAAITFEPRDSEGPAGEVTVVIAIPSLTLGSVSQQAMGADFFAADSFPTATFTATLLRRAEDYLARGTLSLRGVEQPLDLPFTLRLDGDKAVMLGSTVIDRRSFGIGETMSDGDQLGFEVAVDVALSATRAPRP